MASRKTFPGQPVPLIANRPPPTLSTERTNSEQFREAARRDLEGDRVRFEAGRKRAREAAAKELEGARAAEADRASLALAEHARELREVRGAARFWWREEHGTAVAAVRE